MNAPYFPQLIRGRIHECAPDHSVETISVGALRKAAADIEALDKALQPFAKEYDAAGADHLPDDALLREVDEFNDLTVGDLRQAALAVSRARISE